MSDSTSSASGTSALQHARIIGRVSTLVAALRSPPTASISSAIWRAVRRVVPLNAMCSSRCEMPCSSGRSSRLPAPTQTPSEALSRCGMASVTTVRPEGRRVTSTLMQQLLRARRD